MRSVPAREASDSFADVGISGGRIVELVGTPFGQPHLISVTGSLIAGYGNAESDVDVYVVVDGPVAQVPIVAYESGLRVDVRHFDLADLLKWPDLLRGGIAGHADCGAEAYKHYRSRLHAAVRFALGHELQVSGQLAAWSADINGGSWLAEAVVSWWTIEAQRRLLARRWLSGSVGWERSWLQSSDLALAALEGRAARAGHLFFGAKWLAEKFRQERDELGLAALRRCLRWGPRSELESFARYCATLAEANTEFDEKAFRWVLQPAIGVRVEEYLSRYVVSRWNSRGIEIEPAESGVLSGGDRIWSGPFTEAPGGTLAGLFAADMLWLSLVPAGGG